MDTTTLNPTTEPATAEATEPLEDQRDDQPAVDAPARPRLGKVSWSELASHARAEDIGPSLGAVVYLPAFGAEGWVRVLSSSEELEVLSRLEEQPEIEGDEAEPQPPISEQARRKHRNRQRMLLALSLASVEPSFTEEEAALALEAADSALIVDPIYQAASALNPALRLEIDRSEEHDPVFGIVRAQTQAAAALSFAQQDKQLGRVLSRSRWDMAARDAVQPFVDHVELIAALLAAPQLGIAEQLAKALTPLVAQQLKDGE